MVGCGKVFEHEISWRQHHAQVHMGFSKKQKLSAVIPKNDIDTEPTITTKQVISKPVVMKINPMIKNDLSCPESGCTKIFKHQRYLRNHIEVVHNKVQNQSSSSEASFENDSKIPVKPN